MLVILPSISASSAPLTSGRQGDIKPSRGSHVRVVPHRSSSPLFQAATSASTTTFARPSRNGPLVLVAASVLGIATRFRGSIVCGVPRQSQRSARRRSISRAIAMRGCATDTPGPPEAIQLPPCSCRGTLSGVEVYIIGTAHIAAQSATDVQTLLQQINPDSVVVELSRDRIRGLFGTASADGQAGSTLVNIGNTAAGFTDVLDWNAVQPGTVVASECQSKQFIAKAGELIVRGPDVGQLESVQMVRSAGSYDEKWLETLLENAIKKYRYQSPTFQLWPAVSFLAYLTQVSYQNVVRAFYLSIGTAKRTGSEFAAAAEYAQRARCQLVLGDVVDDELFNLAGAYEAARNDSPLVWLAGPLVRPAGDEGGVDIPASLLHIFGSPSVLSQLSTAIWLAIQLWVMLQPGGGLYLLLNIVTLLVAAAYTFLLTAERDERLFTALREAASRTAAKRMEDGGTSESAGGRVVLVCGLAHVNGVARRVANVEGAERRANQ